MREAAVERRTTLAPGRLLDVGTKGYRDTYDLQLELLEQRKNGTGTDTLIVVEHPHVITLGRKKSSQDNVVAAGDVEVVQIERGGDVTYHGPGQLVAYPIVKLEEGERDLHRFLRNLEQAMIDCLAEFGLIAGREEGKTGVWIGGRKLASIGIACRRWVIFHGIALNVTTDLSYFRRINPCGFEANVMTSMQRELGEQALAMAEVKSRLVHHLGMSLGRNFVDH